MTPKKRIFFSDAHIGHADNEQAELFMEFIQEVCIEFDEIIIVGDLFELWSAPRDKVIRDNKALIELLESPLINKKTIYIPGNHDHMHSRMVRFEVIVPIYNFMIDNKKFLVTHGHRQSVEAKLALYPIFSKLMDSQIFVDFMYSMFSLPCLYPLEWLYKWATSRRIVEIQEVLESGAEKLRRWYHRDFVIMGHSHIPVIKDKYANCGNWFDRTDYLTVDEKGGLKLHSYERN